MYYVAYMTGILGALIKAIPFRASLSCRGDELRQELETKARAIVLSHSVYQFAAPLFVRMIKFETFSNMQAAQAQANWFNETPKFEDEKNALEN